MVAVRAQGQTGYTRSEFLRLAAAGGLGLAFAACGVTPGATKQEKVELRFSFVASGHQTPYYLGIDQGFFSKEGIDLAPTEGKGSADTIKVVGAGQYNFGYADLGTMATAVSQGVPVKAIYAVMQRNPLTISFRADSGIKAPADLKGKRFAISTGGSEVVQIPAFLNAVGIDMKDVVVVSVQSGETSSGLMFAGKVDAILGFSTDRNIKYLAEKDGVKVDEFSFADHGVATINHGFFARTETLANNADLVKRFLRGVTNSWKYAADHQEDAIKATQKRFPDIDVGLFRVALANTVKGLHTPKSEGKPLGWMAPEDWQQTISILTKYGGLKPVAIDQYFTNEFIPS